MVPRRVHLGDPRLLPPRRMLSPHHSTLLRQLTAASEETRDILTPEPLQSRFSPELKRSRRRPRPAADHPHGHSPCHPPSSLPNLLRRRIPASLMPTAPAIFTEGEGTSGAFLERVRRFPSGRARLSQTLPRDPLRSSLRLRVSALTTRER